MPRSSLGDRGIAREAGRENFAVNVRTMLGHTLNHISCKSAATLPARIAICCVLLLIIFI